MENFEIGQRSAPLVNPLISPQASRKSSGPWGYYGHEHHPKHHSGGPEVEGYQVS